MLKMRLIICLLLVISFAFSSCSQETVSTTDSFEAIELPDGSIVLLNHNSSIEYDKDFDQREISLTGEAYFNVVASEVPFIVTTDLGEVEVLGTKFNVISNDDEMEVEVESGEVELIVDAEKKKLSKGQAAKYNKERGKVEVGKAKYEFKRWLKELDIEFKKLGKELKKESDKVGKDLKKESKKLNKKLKDLN